MRLSLMLLFKRSVNGHIFRGKNRLVKPVSKQAMATLTREYEQQDENMMYLRNPYLTLEESSGHAKALGKRQMLLSKWRDEKIKMKPHVTIEERLQHLKIKDVWD